METTPKEISFDLTICENGLKEYNTPCPYGICNEKDPKNVTLVGSRFCFDAKKKFGCKFAVSINEPKRIVNCAYGIAGTTDANGNIFLQVGQRLMRLAERTPEVVDDGKPKLTQEQKDLKDRFDAENICTLQFGEGFRNSTTDHISYKKINRFFKAWLRKKTKNGFALLGYTQIGKTNFVYQISKYMVYNNNWKATDIVYKTADEWCSYEQDVKRSWNNELKYERERLLRSQLFIIDDLNFDMKIDQIKLLADLVNDFIRYNTKGRLIVISNAEPQAIENIKSTDIELGRLWGRVENACDIIGIT